MRKARAIGATGRPACSAVPLAPGSPRRDWCHSNGIIEVVDPLRCLGRRALHPRAPPEGARVVPRPRLASPVDPGPQSRRERPYRHYLREPLAPVHYVAASRQVRRGYRMLAASLPPLTDTPSLRRCCVNTQYILKNDLTPLHGLHIMRSIYTFPTAALYARPPSQTRLTVWGAWMPSPVSVRGHRLARVLLG